MSSASLVRRYAHSSCEDFPLQRFSPQSNTSWASAQRLPHELTAGRLGMNERAYYPSADAAALQCKLSVQVPSVNTTFVTKGTAEAERALGVG